MRNRTKAESPESIRTRVNQARTVQQNLFEDSGITCNSQMGPAEMRSYCVLDDAYAALMKQAFDALGLTARSYDRILRVARTIADFDGSTELKPQHIAEAIRYRTHKIGKQ